MVLEDLRKSIKDTYLDNDGEILFFDNPSFDNSIVGIYEDADTIRLVYDYDKMAEELAKDDNIPIDEAIEFIDYNTMRAMGYYAGHPLVIHNLKDYLV